MKGGTAKEAALSGYELERALIRARDLDDRAYALRALSRNVVCLVLDLPGPTCGTPWFGRLPDDQTPLPVVDGRDGNPHVLVFTSWEALSRHYRDPAQVWVQTPAGQLAARTAPAGWPWMVNVAGPFSLVVYPRDQAAIAALYRGEAVSEAFTVGPAAELVFAPPGGALTAVAAAVAGVAGRFGVERVVAVSASLAEPRSATWLLLAVEAQPPVGRPAMESLQQAVAAASPQVVDLRSVASGSGLAERIGRVGHTLWERPG
jgi:hypothetical protein